MWATKEWSLDVNSTDTQDFVQLREIRGSFLFLAEKNEHFKSATNGTKEHEEEIDNCSFSWPFAMTTARSKLPSHLNATELKTFVD